MPLSALAVLLTLIVTVGYIGLCAASPFGTCHKCHGFGFATVRTRTGKPKRGKTCRRCRGHGIRIRLGRHLFNVAARVHRDGTR